jgi:hypothetical protein
VLAAVLADNFTDPAHERLIWLAAGGLVVLGVGLAVLTWFWWRSTKGEHAALAPLEVMGDRSWSKLTHVEQTRRLEGVRLRGEGDVEPDPAPAEPVDLDEALRSFQPGFDDLRDEPAPSTPNEGEAADVAVGDNVVDAGAADDEAAGDVHPVAPSTVDEAEDGAGAGATVLATDVDVSPNDSLGTTTPVEAATIGTVSPESSPSVRPPSATPSTSAHR